MAALSTFTNLVTNPSFETDVANWIVVSGTFTRDTGTSFIGTASGKIINGQVASQPGTAAASLPVGTPVTVTVAMKGAVGGEQILVDGPSGARHTFTITTSWQTYSFTDVTAPPASVATFIQAVSNATWWIDAVGIITPQGGYFDGNTANTATATYGWTATVNDSVSSAIIVPNPNWPIIDEAVSFPAGPNSPMPAPYWRSILERTEGQSTSQRGRQYELDQTQAGTSSLTVQNTDGAFDSGNAASPFYPQVTPYRAHRRRACWPPALAVNLLTADQATAGTASGLSTLPPGVSAYDLGGAGSPCTVSITVGSPNVYKLTYPANSHASGVQFTAFTVIPGTTYTAQVVMVSSNLRISFQWYDQTGAALTSTTTTTAQVNPGGGTSVWTASSTAPAGAAGGALRVGTTFAVANPETDTFGSVQVETGAFPTAFTQPAWFDMVTDYIDGWPQTWTDGGTYGVANLQAVDAFGYLSQRKLLSPAYMECLAAGASGLYPLDEAAGATRFSDLTGLNAALGFTTNNPTGVLAGTAGNTLAASSGVLPQGVGGPVVAFTNPAGGPFTTWIQAATSQTAFSRVIAFYIPPASGGGVWSIQGAPWQVPICSFDTSGTFVTVSGSSPVLHPMGTPATGQWHLFGFTYTPTPNVMQAFMDGATTGPIASAPTVFNGPELIGSGFTYPSGSFYSSGPLTGSVALYAQFPFALTAAQFATLYSTFLNGGSGLGAATSASRFADVLRWARWAGASAVDNYPTGMCNAYGPAVELRASADQAGTDAVSALQTVVDSDNGAHFVAKSGAVTFKARRARYNQTTPEVIFGENTAGGEIPYTTAGFGLDPTRLANDSSIVQSSTNIATRAIDVTSINTYGDVQLQRNVNSLDPLELTDAATYLVQRFKTPGQRLEGITIDAGAYPAAWPALLGLELGDPVRVMRRPPGAPAIQFDGFVEQINWTLTDQMQATCQLQLSALGIGQNLSQLTATRGPLNANVSAGGTSLVVNVPTDAGGNTPKQNGWTPTAITSLQIVDGANTEVVTVTAMTYAAQLVTCTVSALAHAHTAGVTVAENPGVYTYNQFDSVALLDGTHALAY